MYTLFSDGPLAAHFTNTPERLATNFTNYTNFWIPWPPGGLAPDQAHRPPEGRLFSFNSWNSWPGVFWLFSWKTLRDSSRLCVFAV